MNHVTVCNREPSVGTTSSRADYIYNSRYADVTRLEWKPPNSFPSFQHMDTEGLVFNSFLNSGYRHIEILTSLSQ